MNRGLWNLRTLIRFRARPFVHFLPLPSSSFSTQLPVLSPCFYDFSPPRPQARPYSDFSDEDDSFWRLFRRTLQENWESDESLQEDAEKLTSTGTAQTISSTAEKLQDAARELYDQSEGVRQVLSEAAEGAGDLLYAAAEGIGTVADAVAETRPVRALLDELNAEYAQLLKAHYSFRSDHARQKDAEQGVYYNPYTKQFEEMGDIATDEDTTAAALRLDEDGNVMGAESASSGEDSQLGIFARMSGKLIPQSQAAKVLAAIHRRDSTFNLDLFIGNVENILIPRVITAFLRGDKEEIRRYITTTCYRQSIWPLFQAREQEGHQYRYHTLLSVDSTTLFRAMFTEDFGPVLILTSRVQYLHCIEDSETGEILEGGDSDIRARVQMFSLCQDPSGVTQDWEIIELMLGSTMRLAT